MSVLPRPAKLRRYVLVGSLLSVVALLVAGLFWPLQRPNARDVDISGSGEFRTVYFPGDAPVAEVLLIFSVVLALLFLLLGTCALVACKVFRVRASFRGVDFGKGRNAVFDLFTMSCTYSD